MANIPPRTHLHFASSLLYVASLIFLIVLVLRNPMLSDKIDVDLIGMVPIKIDITRQIDPAKVKIPKESKKTIDLTDAASDKLVYQYIRETLLSTSLTTADTIALDPVSPMHKTMLLMGCYGHRWGSVDKLLHKTFMEPFTRVITAAKTPLFVNFMLQALDNNYTKNNTDGDVFLHFSPYDTYDKSVCNCLRDFATPSLLDVHKLSTKKKEHDCEVTEEYTHDSCSFVLNFTLSQFF
jgi:hypothetical protein